MRERERDRDEGKVRKQRQGQERSKQIDAANLNKQINRTGNRRLIISGFLRAMYMHAVLESLHAKLNAAFFVLVFFPSLFLWGVHINYGNSQAPSINARVISSR